MNRVIISGRLIRDPEIRYTTGNNPVAVANFVLAVDRPYAKKDAQVTADFPRVTVMDTQYRKTVENFVSKYLKQGSAVEVVGEIRTGKYEKDGVTQYTTEVFATDIGFAPRSSDKQGESKPAAQPQNAPAPQTAPAQQNAPAPQNAPAGFQQIDDDCPF